MKILGNLVHSLILLQKQLLYRSCVLLITLYSFQLWYYNKALLSYPLKKLKNIQKRVAIWILGAFQMSPSFGIKAIVGLIPIYLYLCKLSERAQLRAHLFPDNHILKSLPSLNIDPYCCSLNSLTSCQQSIIKGSVVDMDNRFNEIFFMFDLLSKEFSSGSRIVDSFSNCFSFYLFKRYSDKSFKS